MNIRKGDKIKLKNPMGVFDNVGEICEILDVQKPLNTLCSEHDKTTISFSFGHGAHLGVMSEDELVTYFEVLPQIPIVGKQHVDRIFDESILKVDTVFDKCTIVSAKLPNGFVIVESSASISPKNYDEDIGVKICCERIKNRIWELEAYRLQQREYDRAQSE